MAIDRVQPLKIESPGSGGVETDRYPEAVNTNEDFLDCRGVSIQDDDSSDELVVFSRDNSGNMTFKDVANTTKTLTDLVAGTGGLTADAHKILRQLIHFIESGPAEGFASGAYCETTGTVFPTAVVWYEDGTKAKKIVERLITWTGANVTTDKWKVYSSSDGSTVLWTISDAISYSGPFETSRTRTITEGDA